MTQSISFRGFDPATSDEEILDNERRFRAAVEDGFRIADGVLRELNRKVQNVGEVVTLVYQISGTTDLYADANATDYTGQTGATDAAATNPTSGIIYYVHDGITYLWAGPRPTTIGVGGDYTAVPDDLVPFGSTVNWDDIVGKPSTFPPSPHTHVFTTGLTDTPSGYVGFAGYWPRVNQAENALVWDQIQEEDVTDLDRMRLRPPQWSQQEYPKNDVVIDPGAGTYWTMRANKLTTQRAAPQEAGDPEWTAPDVPAWVTQSHTGVVQTAMQWTPTLPIVLIGYEIWVPALSPDINYVIRTYAYTEPDQSDIIYREISEPLLTENAWTTIGVQRTLIFSGTTFGIAVNALNSGDDVTVGPFDWGRSGNSNNGGPVSGDWNRRNQNDVVRIHEIDNDGVDRGPNGDGSLEGIIPGSNISIVNKTNANESTSYTVTDAPFYAAGVYEFPVVHDGNGTGGEPAVGTLCVITITVPIPSPTQYVQLSPNPTPGANTVGRLWLDGVEQTGVEGDLFGIRALWDEVIPPTDWDIVSWVGSGGGGGSGGSGGSSFIALPDTPASYVGQAGKAAVVNQAETALEFMTITSGGASVTISDTPPADPGEGDLWWPPSEDVGLFIWYVDSDSGQWVQANGGGGGSGGSGGLVTIAESGGALPQEGFQVWGDMLICYGSATMLSGSEQQSFTFPKAFKSNPRVTTDCVVATGTATSAMHTWLDAITSTGFSMNVRLQRGAAGPILVDFDTPLYYVAIGEALDEDKLPKEITGGGTVNGEKTGWIEAVLYDGPASAPGLLLTVDAVQLNGAGVDPATVFVYSDGEAIGIVENNPIEFEAYVEGWFDIDVMARAKNLDGGWCLFNIYIQKDGVPFDNVDHATGKVYETDLANNYQTVDISRRIYLKVGEKATIHGQRFGGATTTLRLDQIKIRAEKIITSDKVLPETAAVQEFHNTSDFGPSWRIVGTTLEIWGRIGPGVAGTPVVLTHPKTFARRPIVTTSMEWQSRITSVIIADSDTTKTTFSREITSAPTVEDWGVVTYHIIGEWDGT